ncbi:hypothetical protein CDIMF43_300008 [Carnobacterium divergens]|nr:hypothetical protein CDIMF43_300008 [Carnobacterium divergens]
MNRGRDIEALKNKTILTIFRITGNRQDFFVCIVSPYWY